MSLGPSYDAYFSGNKLYGDDLSPPEIEEWFRDEQEGYADLGARDISSYQYVYHALNEVHGFSRIPSGQVFSHVLGFGSAYGDEFLPILRRIERITILEPSDTFVRSFVHGVPAEYVKPSIDGTLPFKDESFDLITCLGVLHHIPNVNYVVKEIFRCLQPGGFALVREPVISMGDWRRPRRGLTKHERGIPLHLLENMICEAGFYVRSERMCVFPLIPKLWSLVGASAYNSSMATHLDSWLAALLKFNLQYHATSIIKKFRPTSVYFVLTKG